MTAPPDLGPPETDATAAEAAGSARSLGSSQGPQGPPMGRRLPRRRARHRPSAGARRQRVRLAQPGRAHRRHRPDRRFPDRVDGRLVSRPSRVAPRQRRRAVDSLGAAR